MAEFKADLSRMVELSFSCKDVPSKDVLSKSDCIAVLYEQTDTGLQLVGHTEYIMNNNNPVFKTRIRVKYMFEREQSFRVSVYDVDEEKGYEDNFSNWITRQEFIGYIDFKLARVVTSRSGIETIMTKPSGELRSAAKIHVRADVLAEANIVAQAEVIGRNWKKDSFFGKDDLQFTISRKRPDGSYFVVRVASRLQDPRPSLPSFRVLVGYPVERATRCRDCHPRLLGQEQGS